MKKVSKNSIGDGCTCQSCGRKYKMDLLIQDKLWILIRDKRRKSDGMLCPICIIKKLERKFDYCAFSMVKI